MLQKQLPVTDIVTNPWPKSPGEHAICWKALPVVNACVTNGCCYVDPQPTRWYPSHPLMPCRVFFLALGVWNFYLRPENKTFNKTTQVYSWKLELLQSSDMTPWPACVCIGESPQKVTWFVGERGWERMTYAECSVISSWSFPTFSFAVSPTPICLQSLYKTWDWVQHPIND